MITLEKSFPKKGIWEQNKDMPQTKDNDILIKVKKTAICGTDVHIYNWDEWSEKTVPLGTTLGHEYVGTIVDVGKNVKGHSIGDRVTSEGHIVCHQCSQCLKKSYHLCPNTIGTGIQRDGAFAEYLSVPAFNVIPIPEHFSDNSVAIFDPFGNAVNTIFKVISKDILNNESLSKDYNTVITGAGPIGIMAAMVLQHLNIDYQLVDINPDKLLLAEWMGIKNAVSPDNIKPHSFNTALEMSGSIRALDSLMDKIENGGNISLLGIFPSATPINLHHVIFKELTIQGVYGREMFDTWRIMMDLINNGLNIEKVITHEFSHKEHQKAFETAASGQHGKVIMDWTN